MIKRSMLLTALLVSGGILALAQAQTTPPAAAPAATPPATDTVPKAVATCLACHGSDGNSAAPDVFPHLAGQPSQYIVKQVYEFKPENGKAVRNGPQMSTSAWPLIEAAGLTAKDISDVAVYFSNQKRKPSTAVTGELTEKQRLGYQIWRDGILAKNVPACASCHGATGKGMPTQYPALVGQGVKYLETQLNDFRAGTRTNDASSMMRSIAIKLTDAEIQAVSDFTSVMDHYETPNFGKRPAASPVAQK